jgi:uncharacterized protein YdeI (YjbR/CyaY-like superfamily)
MEVKDEVKKVYAKTRKDWRKWLEKNQTSETCVWLIIYRKSSDKPSIYYEEAVEEALCFGWIDSIAKKRDEESRFQYFAKRKPKSNWSKTNRERAERMIKEGFMTPTGQAMIDLAKKSGTWTALNDIQNSVIPPDLQRMFDKNKKAFINFSAFTPSSKRIILEWISNAKRTVTRQQRIKQTVGLAEKNIKANHYRQ